MQRKPYSRPAGLRENAVRTDRMRPAEPLELYAICIEYIRHENELMHQRTTWFLAIQSLLGAAIGYIFKEYYVSFADYLSGRPDMMRPPALSLTMWLACCVVGTLTGINAFISIRAAQKAQDRVEDLWKGSFDSSVLDCFPDMMGGKNSTDNKKGGRLARVLAFSASIAWPLLAIMVLATLAPHYESWIF